MINFLRTFRFIYTLINLSNSWLPACVKLDLAFGFFRWINECRNERSAQVKVDSCLKKKTAKCVIPSIEKK